MNEPDFAGVVGRTIAESTPWWPAATTPSEGSPNVVVIVLDDVGFGQLGCYGSPIGTPNIDRIAATGLRYTNFHTTALCSPSRAALLTGRNHHAVGMATLANWNLGFPGSRGFVTPKAATLAEILRSAGYNTFAVGKWHLTPGDQQTAAGPYDHWPLQRGFERYYGFLDAATSHWRPELTHDNHRIETPALPGYHLTEDLVDHAIEFVRDQVSVAPDRPFFLYLALGAAHEPHHAPPSFIGKYEGAFDTGWDAYRDETISRQKELGIVPPNTELPPSNPGVQRWADLPEEERRLYARLQEAFAGMLDHADHHIGRLVHYLEHIGKRDDTVLIIVSDNGASQEGSFVGTTNTIIYHNSLDDTVENNLRHFDDIGTERGYNNYPLGWAMAGNTPCRWYKRNTHGGGVRDPMIVSWPAGISAAGEVRRQFHHMTDVVPTVLEIVGIEAPAVCRGIPQMPIHGVSMRYSFDDPDAATTKASQHFEMFGNRGIWADGWKAVARHEQGTSFELDQWELYDLERDFSECHNLTGVHPEKLRELIDLWWAAAEEYNVLPLDDRLNERWLSQPSPGSVKARDEFRFLPGTPHIGPEAAPDTKNVSFAITARLARGLSAGAEGVLLANGGCSGGYSLFVAGGRLCFTYNFAGTLYRVSGPITLPSDVSAVGCRFKKTGPCQGQVELWAGGELIASGPIPRTLPYLLSLEGLDVGQDRLTPVDPHYLAPFHFTDEVVDVTLTLGDDRELDGPGLVAAQVSRQ